MAAFLKIDCGKRVGEICGDCLKLDHAVIGSALSKEPDRLSI
ncbi:MULTISPECIES: hypothetical protein [unclassified Bradyrhizobium]|nr:MULTISPECIES: hypothetical protein [unclassified Bradyrhizobium]WOH55987.1 hypothetical protein RX329_27330 [Bradyrhizobium sp. BWC-3-1]